MAVSYQQRIAARSAERFQEVVEETKKSYMEFFSLLVDAKSPEERQAFYQNVDWNWLQHLDPDLWAKLSQDALNLEKEQQKKRIDELAQFEQQQYTEAHAFRPQIEPFGFTPSSPAAAGLGLSSPLPLGRFGR